MGLSVTVPPLDLSPVEGWSLPPFTHGMIEAAERLANTTLLSCPETECPVTSVISRVVHELEELTKRWNEAIHPVLIELFFQTWSTFNAPISQPPASKANLREDDLREDDASKDYILERPSHSECPVLLALRSIVNPFVSIFDVLKGQVGGVHKNLISEVDRAFNTLDHSMQSSACLVVVVSNMANLMVQVKALTLGLKKTLHQAPSKPLKLSKNPLFCTDAPKVEMVVQEQDSDSSVTGTALKQSQKPCSLASAPTLEAPIALLACKAPVSLHSQSKLSDSFNKVKTGVASLGVVRAFSVLCQQLSMRWHQMAVGEHLRSLCKTALGLSPGLFFAGSLGAWPAAMMVPRS